MNIIEKIDRFLINETSELNFIPFKKNIEIEINGIKSKKDLDKIYNKFIALVDYLKRVFNNKMKEFD